MTADPGLTSAVPTLMEVVIWTEIEESAKRRRGRTRLDEEDAVQTGLRRILLLL